MKKSKPLVQDMQIDKVEFIANTQPLGSVFKLNPSILASPTPFRNVKFIDIEGIMVKCLSHALFLVCGSNKICRCTLKKWSKTTT
jgi:hypothetical protein